MRIEYRILIDVPQEREDVYLKMKEIFDYVYSVARNGGLKTGVRLRAVRIMAYIVQVLTGVLKDVEIEKLEREVEDLKRLVEAEKGDL